MKGLTKKEIFDKYKKISGTLPPYVMEVQNENLQEEVRTFIAEAYLDGYKKGKKKYKRFKTKFLELRDENEQLKKQLESFQDKQVATVNRLEMMKAIEQSGTINVLYSEEV